MPDRVAGRKGSGVAGAQKAFPVILDQRQRAGQDIGEFVLGLVPMPVAGAPAGVQPFQRDAELRQPSGIAQGQPAQPGEGTVGVGAAVQPRQAVRVKDRHQAPSGGT